MGRALPLPIWSVRFLHGSHSRGSQRPIPREGQLHLLSHPGHKAGAPSAHLFTSLTPSPGRVSGVGSGGEVWPTWGPGSAQA